MVNVRVCIQHVRTFMANTMVLVQMRLGIVLHDQKLARASLVEAKELNEKGGDWDRRNRLKVYEGVLAMGSRGQSRRCRYTASFLTE